eukprot:m.120921 g.120921  ORF g.120921 m.120921 type:complete len:140 (-) comp13695_c1_seq3:72-491(-)
MNNFHDMDLSLLYYSIYFFQCLFDSNLYSMPIYVFAAIVVIIIARQSDARMQHRGKFLFCTMAVVLVGFILLSVGVKVKTTVLSVIGACFSTAGAYSSVPLTLAWVTDSLSMGTATATGTAFVIGFGNLGGIVGPQVRL